MFIKVKSGNDRLLVNSDRILFVKAGQDIASGCDVVLDVGVTIPVSDMFGHILGELNNGKQVQTDTKDMPKSA